MAKKIRSLSNVCPKNKQKNTEFVQKRNCGMNWNKHLFIAIYCSDWWDYMNILYSNVCLGLHAKECTERDDDEANKEATFQMNRTIFQTITIQKGLFSQNKGREDISILTIFKSTQQVLRVTVHRAPYGLCFKWEPPSLPYLHPESHYREAPFGKESKPISRGAKQRIHASYCWVVSNICTLFQILQSILK